MAAVRSSPDVQTTKPSRGATMGTTRPSIRRRKLKEGGGLMSRHRDRKGAPPWDLPDAGTGDFDPHAQPAPVYEVELDLLSVGGIRGNGNIPVALLGSADFDVRNVRIDNSLRFDSLAPRLSTRRASRIVPIRASTRKIRTRISSANSRTPRIRGRQDQTIGTLTGKLINGVPIRGTRNSVLPGDRAPRCAPGITRDAHCGREEKSERLTTPAASLFDRALAVGPIPTCDTSTRRFACRARSGSGCR